MNESGQYSYGRFLIRTFASGGKVKARAFAGAKAVAYAEDKSTDLTLVALKAIIDDRNTFEFAARQNGIPTAVEYSDAFSRLGEKVGKQQWQMLRALFSAPYRTMTAAQLAASAAYSKVGTSNERFRKLARMIADDLGYRPDLWPDGSTNWISALATCDPSRPRSDPELRWAMRIEVADCLSTVTKDRPPH